MTQFVKSFFSTWFSGIALALTILGNAKGLIELADWAELIVSIWQNLIHQFWLYVFLPFSLDVPLYIAQILTLAAVLYSPAIVSRIRYGEWEFVRPDGYLIDESVKQNYYVPIIAFLLIPAYFYLFMPEVIRPIFNECILGMEIGKWCENENIEIYGSKILGISAISVILTSIYISLFSIGHPRVIFWSLFNGLIFCMIVFFIERNVEVSVSNPRP